MKKITALLMAAMMMLCLPAAFAVELPEGVPSTLQAPTISNLELLKMRTVFHISVWKLLCRFSYRAG